MYIRYFVNTNKKESAINLVEESLIGIQEKIIYKQIKKTEPYWKIDNIYIVEMEIEIQKESITVFLNLYSDNWIEYGNPTDELISSKNNKECAYMKKGFEMINIFF